MIGFILFACTSNKENFGKLIVAEYYPIYENDDSYFPHDYFVEVDMQGWLDTAVFVEKKNNYCYKSLYIL